MTNLTRSQAYDKLTHYAENNEYARDDLLAIRELLTVPPLSEIKYSVHAIEDLIEENENDGLDDAAANLKNILNFVESLAAGRAEIDDDKIHELPEFKTLLKEMRKGNALTLEAMGESLGYSATYLSDLERGKRLPSVQFIDRVCEWSGRGPGGRKIWHIAGATAHGWEIDYDTCGGDGEPAEIDDEEVNNALRNLGLLQADIRIKQHTRNRINGLSDLITRLYHQTREDRDVALAIAETYNGELQDKLELAERQRDEALEALDSTARALRSKNFIGAARPIEDVVESIRTYSEALAAYRKESGYE